MITPPTECFYIVYAEGSAIERVMANISKRAAADITLAVLISKDFTDDMTATIELDQAVEQLKSSLNGELIEHVEYNPLYVPSSQDDIDEVLDGDVDSNDFDFIGLDGDPFTLKMMYIASSEVDLIDAKIAYRPFNLPGYEEIIAAQNAVRLQ